MKPHRHLTLFLLALLLAALTAGAQQLRIISIQKGLEPMYKSLERLDNNGQICPLVKYQFPREGLVFEGPVVGNVQFRDGEYWVYYEPGTKMVRVKGSGYYATEVVNLQPMLGGEALESNRIYIARLEASDGAETKTEIQTHNYLILATDPAVEGATVTLDGRTYFTDASGAMQAYLPLGSYPYRIAAEGFEEAAGSATVSAGDTPSELRVSLLSVMGRMKVTSPTAAVEVYVNNARKGTAPLELVLAEGTYRVELRKAGHRPLSRDVSIIRGQTSAADFAPLEALTGSLNVAYTPTYATVTIDGREAGKSPRIFRDLPVGTHSVAISYPGFASRTHTVTISEGATAELSGSLEKVAVAAAPAPAAGQWRTTARNLDLAVSRDGRNYFFSESEWAGLPSSEKNAFRKLGIVIDKDGQRFMWSLTDDAVGINWDDAMSRFGDRLPSKRQGEALASQHKAVNKAILAYGGDFQGVYWTKDEKNSSYAWGVSMNYGYVSTYNKHNASKVRAVAPVPGGAMATSAPTAGQWRTTARNLDLAVSRDGRTYFLSESEWAALSSSEKNAFRKLGIVIDNKGQRFMWSLSDDAKGINWHDAMSRFGDRLPSKAQGEALASQHEAVNKAILAYGGTSMIERKDGYAPWYWTKEEKDSSNAWSVYMKFGGVPYSSKYSTYRVRAVVPVPEADAK